tara:strand:+ start:370 stop:921 length:552 start_codon:yes stop_codon:yes gene_type:complete
MAKQKSAKGFAQDILKKERSLIETQLNQLIKETITDLTKGVNGSPVSPVLTGFFASSWKASTGNIIQKDKREHFPAWAKIKTTTVGKQVVLAPGESPRLKIRHYVPTKFRIGDSIGIGNTAEYTEQALQSNKSKLLEYILGAGGLEEKMDRIFSDKNRPKMSIKAEGGGLSAPTNYSDGYQDL